MAAIESLRRAVDALSRHRVLFVAGLLYGLVVLPQTALQMARVPIAPTLLSVLSFFVTPFLVAGLVGMADEAIDDGTGLQTLRTVGRARYVQLLLGNLVRFAIHVVFAVATVAVLVGVLFATGLASTVAGGGLPANPAALAPIVVVFLAAAALLLLVTLFIQFYAVAIVLDDADAIEGFRLSVGVVSDHFLSTVGYSLVTLVVTLVANLPVAGYVAARTMGRGASAGGQAGVAGGLAQFGPGAVGAGAQASFSMPELVGLVAASTLATVVVVTFRLTYATAFYRRHTTSVEERVLGT